MKQIRKIIFIVLAILLLPMICTSFIKKESKDERPKETIEEMLPQILSEQVNGDEEEEFLKAMAVVERTHIYYQMEKGKNETEIVKEQADKMWKSNQKKDITKLKNAVKQTFGQVIVYDEKYICPEYHYLSAGKTRSMKEAYGKGDEPYLTTVSSEMDMKSDDYIQVFYIKQNQYQMICENVWKVAGKEYIEEKKDAEEYVTFLTLDGKKISGESFRKAFELPSSAFHITKVDGYIRIVTKGQGHGFGMSMYGANEMAKMGATYKSILEYYYSGAKVESE